MISAGTVLILVKLPSCERLHGPLRIYFRGCCFCTLASDHTCRFVTWFRATCYKFSRCQCCLQARSLVRPSWTQAASQLLISEGETR
eukprot:4154031-Amphidinium_carterae.1